MFFVNIKKEARKFLSKHKGIHRLVIDTMGEDFVICEESSTLRHAAILESSPEHPRPHTIEIVFSAGKKKPIELAFKQVAGIYSSYVYPDSFSTIDAELSSIYNAGFSIDKDAPEYYKSPFKKQTPFGYVYLAYEYMAHKEVSVLKVSFQEETERHRPPVCTLLLRVGDDMLSALALVLKAHTAVANMRHYIAVVRQTLSDLGLTSYLDVEVTVEGSYVKYRAQVSFHDTSEYQRLLTSVNVDVSGPNLIADTSESLIKPTEAIKDRLLEEGVQVMVLGDTCCAVKGEPVFKEGSLFYEDLFKGQSSYQLIANRSTKK